MDQNLKVPYYKIREALQKIPNWTSAMKRAIKGPFIYYVIIFLGFLNPLPPCVRMFLVLKIIKNWHFLTPLTSDYVINEWSLSSKDGNTLQAMETKKVVNVH